MYLVLKYLADKQNDFIGKVASLAVDLYSFKDVSLLDTKPEQIMPIGTSAISALIDRLLTETSYTSVMYAHGI